MIKRKASVLILMCAISVFLFPSILYASSDVGVKVNVRVEGYNSTIAEGSVYAYTFSDALSILAKENNINIQISHSQNGDTIYSIENIENGVFKGNDKWMAFIDRGGKIITDHYIFGKALQTGDNLVVYYGEFAKTNFLSVFDLKVTGNTAEFSAGIQNSTWDLENGSWVLDDGIKPVADVRIAVKLPNNNLKVLKTDADGKAKTTFSQPGVYIYNGEDFSADAIPKIVPTGDYYYLYGIHNDDSVTRGEAVAFIVSCFELPDNHIEFEFIDVDSTHKYYNEISAAVRAGVIVGTGEGAFEPDKPVNLLQLSVMIANLYNRQDVSAKTYSVPDWAQNSVNVMMSSGLLQDIHTEWYGDVNSRMLLQIYKNLKGIL